MSCWHVTKVTCKPPCRAASQCVDNTRHFYWGLKLHWQNKWPGKKTPVVQINIVCSYPSKLHAGQGTGKKKDRQERKGGEGLSYLHLTYVYVSIYGMWNVANPSQKPVFPIHLLKDKRRIAITSFVLLINKLPATFIEDVNLLYTFLKACTWWTTSWNKGQYLKGEVEKVWKKSLSLDGECKTNVKWHGAL